MSIYFYRPEFVDDWVIGLCPTHAQQMSERLYKAGFRDGAGDLTQELEKNPPPSLTNLGHPHDGCAVCVRHIDADEFLWEVEGCSCVLTDPDKCPIHGPRGYRQSRCLR